MSYKGLILAGGGVKGFCLLGAIQRLYDKNKIDQNNLTHFSGSSIGGIISFFLAIGYSPTELMVYMCTKGVFESLKINALYNILAETTLYEYSVIDNMFEKMTIEKIGYVPTLNELYEKHGKTLVVSTYNLTKLEIEYISYKNYPDLNCLKALRMTSNLPFIFGEFFNNEYEYIDGGIVDNLPLSTIDVEIPKIGIGFEYSEEELDLNIGWGNKILNKIYKILMVPVSEREKEKIKNLCESHKIEYYKINPGKIMFYKFSITNQEKMDLFSIGYNSIQ